MLNSKFSALTARWRANQPPGGANPARSGRKRMADSSAAAQLSGWRAITSYQWLVFAVVWAGWTLDAADFGLVALVLRPALVNLLGFPTTGALDPAQAAQIGKYGGLLIMTGLLGWAAGGVLFGIFAGYIVRRGAAVVCTRPL